MKQAQVKRYMTVIINTWPTGQIRPLTGLQKGPCPDKYCPSDKVTDLVICNTFNVYYMYIFQYQVS